MKILLLEDFIHRKNREAFFLMCSSIGAELIVSSDPLKFQDTYELVLIPCGLLPCYLFPNTKRIMYGPHNFVFPTPPWQRNSQLFDKRCVYNCLSSWVKEAWMEFGSVCLPVVTLPFAVDVHRFTPAIEEKSLDCLVYFKHREQSLLLPVEKELKRLNLSFQVVRYGSYHEETYLKILQKVKFGIWLGSHESQGFALEEALSCNVPLLVLNVKSMFDEFGDNNQCCYTNEIGRYKLKATSATYWNDQCGMISSIERFSQDIPRMVNTYTQFSPREYILETLSPEVCIKRFLEF